MQQALLTITHALYEGNPQPVLANTEKLNDTVAELRQLIAEHKGDGVAETPIHGYVWLNMENGATAGVALTFNLSRAAQIKSR